MDNLGPASVAKVVLGLCAAPASRENMKPKPGIAPDRFQPPAFNYTLPHFIHPIPMYFTEPTTTSRHPLAITESSRGEDLEDHEKTRAALERVSLWVLDQLRGSKMEQVRHKTFSDNTFLDDNEWWACVERCWPQDQAGGTLRRTSLENSQVSMS